GIQLQYLWPRTRRTMRKRRPSLSNMPTLPEALAISSVMSWAVSLPLDRPRRLARDVVRHAVDAAHLVDDAVGDAAEEGVVERVVVGGHAVGRGDGAQRAGLVVGAPVAHHTHSPHRQ